MSAIQPPSIVGIGEVLWDLLPDGPKLGGASANFAVFCARLGNRAELISSAGDDDLGHAALRQLNQPGLELRNLQIAPEHPTGTVGVEFTAENQPSYSIREGVAWDFISLTSGVLKAAAAADAVCFGTLAQRNPVSRATIRGFVEATSGDCVRICDVNLRMPYCNAEILRWSLAHSTVIKVSDEELSTFFSLLALGEAPAAPEPAAHLLLEHFPAAAMVAITLGAKGSLLTTRTETATHPGFPITLVDTVGAGDAFTAGLTHAYLRGAPLAEVARVGNLCGSFVASRQGASPPLTGELLTEIAAILSLGPAPRK
jgi:fructokinase